MCEGFDKILQWDEAEKVPKLHLGVPVEGEGEEEKKGDSCGNESEVVLHTQKGVRFYTDKGEVGRGVLQVTSMRLLWFQPDAAPLSGYETDWTRVTLHAISRDPESGYPPCIYCQISLSEEELLCECRFVPDDPSSCKQIATFLYFILHVRKLIGFLFHFIVESIFESMSKASEMNPDPAEDDDDMDGDDDAFVASGDFDFPISYEGGDVTLNGDEEDDDDKTKESNGGFKRKL